MFGLRWSHFGHIMSNSLEKSLVLGNMAEKRRRAICIALIGATLENMKEQVGDRSFLKKNPISVVASNQQQLDST